jgi:hypothetical protein
MNNQTATFKLIYDNVGQDFSVYTDSYEELREFKILAKSLGVKYAVRFFAANDEQLSNPLYTRH